MERAFVKSIGMAVLIVSCVAVSYAVSSESGRTALSAVTTLSQLNQLPGEDQSRVAAVDVEGTIWWSNQLPGAEHSRVASVNIEGTVWWSSKQEGRIILKDDTAVVQLELDFPCEMPNSGDRLVLKGDCTAIKTTDVIKLSGVPLVDNDGLHPPEEKSGTTHLKAGRYPIRVLWFNRTDRHDLDVEIEGPGMPRQKISGDRLSRLQNDPVSGTTDFVQGLDYRCYEGEWWRFLPNFDHLPPVKTGVVDDFDIAVRTRDNHVGLLFSGFIDIPRDGTYSFYVSSDDGSRLFIGDSSLRTLSDGRTSLPATADEVSFDDSEYRWSVMDGTVTSFHRVQGGLELDLMTEAGVVMLKVAEDSDRSYILRPQNRIRGAGVSRKIHKLDGRQIRGEFYVQSWDDIEQYSVTSKVWNEYPLVKIGSLLTRDSSNAVESVVHIKGNLSLSDTDQSVVLDDESGQLMVDDMVVDIGIQGAVDMLGRVCLDGTNLMLRNVHYRKLGEDGAGPDSLQVLTTAEQICQLSFEEAAKGYPVNVQGVIISILDYNGAVIHDSSRGIYIVAGSPVPLQVGDYCDIEGVTGPFGFDPYIQVSGFRKIGKGLLPNPVQPTRYQLINGTLHCNYVEIEGVIASVKEDTIALLTRDGRINMRLNPIGAEMPSDSLGATVRLRGCLLNDWDGESRRVVVGSMYLDQHQVTVVQPAPADPFDIAMKHVGDLLQFDPQAGALQRVKVSGLLIYRNDRMSYLMDEEHGLRFVTVEGADDVLVGDKVEVVGFMDLSGPSPLLRDAVIRRLGHPGLVPPKKLNVDNLLSDEHDSTRVQVTGVLLDVSRRSDGVVLEIQSGHRRFMAVVDGEDPLDDALVPGCHLELTGVYVGQGGNRVLGRPIDAFEIRLNSSRDIRIISRPSWWTLRRLVLVVGVLVGILLATLVWINLLHRKVEERTQQLGDQIRRRQRIERERALEQERARLAGSLHDDLGAGLTEVNMLTTLIKSDATSRAQKEEYAKELNKLALGMVTSLDEIVWAQNPRNDSLSSLAGYFCAYAQRLLELASISCGLDVADNLPDHPLDPKFRQELFLVLKEALSNVVKHANAAKVWLRIAFKEEQLIVVVSDDGCGIIEGEHEIGEDGLSNMQDRMKALGGSCAIESHADQGTTVRFQAPIREVKR